MQVDFVYTDLVASFFSRCCCGSTIVSALITHNSDVEVDARFLPVLADRVSSTGTP